MDTSRLTHMFLQHLPDFFKKKFTSRENRFSQNLNEQYFSFASMTNLSSAHDDDYVYDTDGYLLLMQTTQSNLSLFNVSCDSLVFNEYELLNMKSRQSLNRLDQYSNSSIDIYSELKKSHHHSTMDCSEQTNTLQRWQGLELLNTYT